jgi:hypothetical protein
MTGSWVSSRRLSTAAVVVCCAVTAGCGDSTGSQEQRTPSVSFELGGARSSSFQVSTDADVPGSVPRSFLYSYTNFGAFFVRAFRLRDASAGDLVSVVAPSAPGTYRLEPAACGVLVTCPNVAGGLGMDFATEHVSPDGAYFALTGGTITVTRSGADRIEGTFSGTGVTQRLVDGELVVTGQITIRNGRFSAIPKVGSEPAFERLAP